MKIRQPDTKNLQHVKDTAVIHTILTKLFTKLNVQRGNDKKAYTEAGGLHTVYRPPGTIW